VSRELGAIQLANPIYIQLALTLPAHDKPSDALRVLRSIRELKRTEAADLIAVTEEEGNVMANP
jgi:hypothetical protein